MFLAACAIEKKRLDSLRGGFGVDLGGDRLTASRMASMIVSHFAIIIELTIIGKWQTIIGESPVGLPLRI